ncbi:prolipoprotein diacylglyceryl transferase [Paenibacillus guangzhouensis]|uniref:prolipoprotein diacylglyceryl transferase n=1 Tax=Paenibacillus guangzhouensis TaxID=1473112 RepID=UPI001D124A17|nr:prolipoprotein diacylglyceryl transferase family protein [Paenibacillus guangzhouensis]
MQVILFHIGNFPIRSYGLMIAVAIFLSSCVAYYLARGTVYRKHLSDLLIYIIVGGIVGARLWEVLFFQGDYYAKHVLEAFQIWNGGLSIQGGLIGGFLAGLFPKVLWLMIRMGLNRYGRLNSMKCNGISSYSQS